MFTQKLDKYNNKLSNYIGGADSNITITINFRYANKLRPDSFIINEEPIPLVISKDYTGLMIKEKTCKLNSQLNIENQTLVHSRTHTLITNDKIPEWNDGDQVVIVVEPPKINIAELNRRHAMMVPNYLPPGNPFSPHKGWY
jgi:hypothetical protein